MAGIRLIWKVRRRLPGGINNVFKYSTDWYNELVRRDADPSLDKVRVNDKGEYEYFGNYNLGWISFIKIRIYSTEHNVSISGGNERARYYVSGRYYNQDGIYNAGDEKYTQYNIRSKEEIQINKSLLLENNTDVMIFRSHPAHGDVRPPEYNPPGTTSGISGDYGEEP